MKKAGFAWTALVLGSGLVAGITTSCSGSGSGSGGFEIVSCNLGCSGSGLGQVTCGIQNVHKNTEIRIRFNEEVDLASVSPFTFQVSEEGTGKTPAGTYLLGAEPDTLVFRPDITFDSAGNPVFGFEEGSSYTLRLPGQVQDPSGPWVRSVGGGANRHRMLCTVRADLGLLDAKPGKPSVETTLVQVLFDEQGEPVGELAGVPAAGAVDVATDSPLSLLFDDLMDPSTLVNPVSKTSQTVEVLVDADGDLATPGDRVPVGGSFAIALDQDALTTLVTFTPTDGYPSKGSDPDHPRRVVIAVSGLIRDLAGNPLDNPSQMVFTPQLLPFEETELVETFQVGTQEDTSASGADWGRGAAGARAGRGLGGTGRLDARAGHARAQHRLGRLDAAGGRGRARPGGIAAGDLRRRPLRLAAGGGRRVPLQLAARGAGGHPALHRLAPGADLRARGGVGGGAHRGSTARTRCRRPTSSSRAAPAAWPVPPAATAAGGETCPTAPPFPKASPTPRSPSPISTAAPAWAWPGPAPSTFRSCAPRAAEGCIGPRVRRGTCRRTRSTWPVSSTACSSARPSRRGAWAPGAVTPRPAGPARTTRCPARCIPRRRRPSPACRTTSASTPSRAPWTPSSACCGAAPGAAGAAPTSRTARPTAPRP